MSETTAPDTAEVSGTGGVAGLAPVEWQRRQSMTPSSPCRKRFGYCDWAEVLVDVRGASEGVGSVTGLSVSAGWSMKRNSSATLRSKASRAREGSPRCPAVVAPSRSIT